MELCDYIKNGIERCGSASTLANSIGIQPQHLSNAKAHQRGLPNDACVKLAKLVGAEAIEIIAASELATEKKAEKREFWNGLLSQFANRSYIRHMMN